MRTFGIILILAGIAMLVFRGINFTQEKKIVDLGPVQINKKEKKHLDWPMYAGAIVTAAGVFIAMSGGKKRR